MSETMLTCASHSPLMYCRTTKPPQEEEIIAAFALRAETVRSFAPEVIFSFGPDHYTSMFQRLAPAFVMGTKAEAVGDIGGHAGKLDVPYQLAFDCIDAVYKAGVDVAVSHDLRIDHGSSQALHRVAGGISAFPTIPILINIFTQPLPPFRRSRLLGEAIGTFAKNRGLRALFLGSGGLSHNPEPIFPAVGKGGDMVDDYMRSGPGLQTDREDVWLKRQNDIHIEAAGLMADGAITAEDCCFNIELDRECLDIIARGELEIFDAWSPKDLIEEAGIGSVELSCWIAAAAAHRAAGGGLPQIDYYDPVLQYGVAVGIAHG
jgi:2,3-dihydroxyphenylpropionate 1,2-dioxygenase